MIFLFVEIGRVNLSLQILPVPGDYFPTKVTCRREQKYASPGRAFKSSVEPSETEGRRGEWLPSLLLGGINVNIDKCKTYCEELMLIW